MLPLAQKWCQTGTMSESTKTPRERLNLRLPPDLKAQLQQYSDSLGVPLNTAAILVLRTYLPAALSNGMQSVKPPPKPARPIKQALPSEAQPPVPSSVARLISTPPGRPRVGRNEPCPCGSGKKAKQCHPEWT
ncbi:hypothetical protein XarbCFBP7629_15265 [Xanthomonas arboricola]|nr:hypothetical protein XarbCFBP7629_15265 [Xanthomonas arboricola]